MFLWVFDGLGRMDLSELQQARPCVPIVFELVWEPSSVDIKFLLASTNVFAPYIACNNDKPERCKTQSRHQRPNISVIQRPEDTLVVDKAQERPVLVLVDEVADVRRKSPLARRFDEGEFDVDGEVVERVTEREKRSECLLEAQHLPVVILWNVNVNVEDGSLYGCVCSRQSLAQLDNAVEVEPIWLVDWELVLFDDEVELVSLVGRLWIVDDLPLRSVWVCSTHPHVPSWEVFFVSLMTIVVQVVMPIAQGKHELPFQCSDGTCSLPCS